MKECKGNKYLVCEWKTDFKELQIPDTIIKAAPTPTPCLDTIWGTQHTPEPPLLKVSHALSSSGKEGVIVSVVARLPSNATGASVGRLKP